VSHNFRTYFIATALHDSGKKGLGGCIARSTLCVDVFPPSIRRILGELPKTLDNTNERVLLEIDEEKRAYAHKLFQCLVKIYPPA
jgi:hypothetical protein